MAGILYVDDGYVAQEPTQYFQTGVSIDWDSKVIFVPILFLELVQTTPTLIYRLDTNLFRLALKELEASAIGMAFVDTHQHNPPVSVGGVELARVIQIINDFTVTFEDGQYAVNLFGSNNNIGDVVNVNQVSVRSSNSAGLVNSAAIEYSEYGGGVTVDPEATSVGTAYPVGTARRPVDNLVDAITIATARGFKKLFILGDITIDAGLVYDEMTIEGVSETTTDIFISAAASVIDTTFKNARVSGTLDGGSAIVDCIVEDVQFFNGLIDNSILKGNIQLGGTTDAIITNCSSGVTGQATPRIDMGGDGPSLILRNYNGGIEIANKTGNTLPSSSLDINSGQVKFLSNVATGVFTVRGIGKVVNNSTGNAIIETELLDTVNLNKTLFQGKVTIDTTIGEPGTHFPIGTTIEPSNNLVDAKIIASVNNLRSYGFDGVHLVTENHTNWLFEGRGPVSSTLVLLGAANVSGSSFRSCSLTGDFASPTTLLDIRDCGLENASNFSGIVADTGIGGNISFGSNVEEVSRFIECTVGTTEPIIDLASINKIIFTTWEGAITFINGHANTEVVFDCLSGNITIDSSCTDGLYQIRGIGTITNNALGSNVNITAELLDSVNLNKTLFAGTTTIDPSVGIGGTAFPIGTTISPSNNIIDAQTIANTNNLRSYTLDGLHVVTTDHLNWLFDGRGPVSSILALVGVADVSGSSFRDVAITGDFMSPTTLVDVRNCGLESTSNFAGIVANTGIGGNISFGSNVEQESRFITCTTGTTEPIIDLASTNKVIFTAWEGAITFINGHANTEVVFDCLSGNITIDSSCTDGLYQIRGIGTINNLSTDSNVNITAELLDSVNLNKTLFQGAVHLEQTVGRSGIAFPIGTSIDPSNNISEAKIIAGVNNLTKYELDGTYVVLEDHDNWLFEGRGPVSSILVLVGAASVSGAAFRDVAITGDFANPASIVDVRNCGLENVTNFCGVVVDTGIGGNISFCSNADQVSRFIECTPGTTDPVIDLANAGKVIFTTWEGAITFINGHANTEVIFDCISGNITLDSSCVAGSYIIRGVGTVNNETTNSNVTVTAELLDSVNLNKTLFENGHVYVDALNLGRPGVKFPIGTAIDPSDNLLDARAIANANNLHKYEIDGAFIGLPTAHTDWDFNGRNPSSSAIVLNGVDISGSRFLDLGLTGNVYCPNGFLDVRSCGVQDVQNFRGSAGDSGLGGTITLHTGATGLQTRFQSCTRAQTEPTIDLTGYDGELFVSKFYAGTMTLANASSTSTIYFNADGANVIIDNTCVDATIELSGVGFWENEDTYTGNCVIINKLHNPRNMWEYDITNVNVTGSAANVLVSEFANIATSLTTIEGTGGSLTTEQAQQIAEIYAMHGLDPTKPLIVTKTDRTAGANINQTIDAGAEITTVTRDPGDPTP